MLRNLLSRWILADLRQMPLQRKSRIVLSKNPLSSRSEQMTDELNGQNAQNGKYQRYAKWASFSVVIGGGALYLLKVFVPDWREFKDAKHYYTNWKLRAYCSLPLNALSRLSGTLSHMYIPTPLRRRILGIYAKAYDCNISEAEVEDLTAYPTLASFFNRPLKKHLRPISESGLVSPADGVVCHYGKVEHGRIEFVKGHDYDITDFLGSVEMLKKQKGNVLYQIVIYLAPGNYHGFHSPVTWHAYEESHYPGKLLTVRPTFLNRLPHLFCINERVVLKGVWKHGFFSMSAVAATNVGDVYIEADPLLQTNIKRAKKEINESIKTIADIKYEYKIGEKVGEFRLGSTIVLIFEAPPSLQFAVKAGDKLRYGQSLTTTSL